MNKLSTPKFKRNVLIATLASVITFAGTALAGDKVNTAPVNPNLIGNSDYPMIHFDSAATDHTTLPAWLGDKVVKQEEIQWIPTPPLTVGHAQYTYPGGEEVMYVSGSNRVNKIRMTDGKMELIDVLKLDELGQKTATDDEVRAMVDLVESAGADESKYLTQYQEWIESQNINTKTAPYGMYTMIDKNGYYYAGWGTKVFKFGDVKKGDINSKIEIVEQFDLKNGLPADKADTISRMMGFAMTYDGNIAVALPGMIAVLDNNFENMQYISMPGEAIDNGISIDKDGGIYVVTSKYMRKVVWDGEKLSDKEADGAWKSPYDAIPNKNSLSRGAGNTPTLMGFGDDEDKLVILADAGDPVKIVAFWRNEIPEDFKQKPGTKSRRIADQLALTIDVPATIEWSPHVYGYGVMMQASAYPTPVFDIHGKYDLHTTVLSGNASRGGPVGSEKWNWNPEKDEFERQWTTDIPLQWCLHPISSATNTVHMCKLDKGEYSLVGLDWTTGEEVGTTYLGKSPIFNVGGGFIKPLANGDLFLTGAFGPVRISK